jgi:gas vesicle protein
MVFFAIRAARQVIPNAGSKGAFADAYEGIHREISCHPILGHAWKEFDETLVKAGHSVRNTLRPQAFFSYAALKEKLVGLKIMPGVPGYFVGIGLLLTFIGLVIALSKAASGTEAAHLATGGAGAEAMQGALRELLQAATFKFSTSIAGLGASIFLSFCFRLFVIANEASLAAFCEALEEKLDYVAPQSVTLQMVEKLDGQLAELKGINSDKFILRLGEQVGPSVQTALQDAIAPLTERIGDAVNQLTTKNQSGVEELVSRFSESLHGGAGTELRELATSLKAMQGNLEKVRADLSCTGEDFARQMSHAAENLNRLVGEAGRNLGQQSDRSRETMEVMLGSLREIFDRASSKIDENLAGAAEAASGRLEQAMERVLGQMEGQVAGLRETFGGFQASTATYLEDTRAKIAEAQDRTIETMSTTSLEAAAALERGLGKAMEEMRREVESFSAALRLSAASLGTQTSAMDGVALRSREAADMFARSADAIRGAVEPVTRSNEKLTATTQAIGEALGLAVASLGEGQKAAATLAESIAAQTTHLTNLWADYEKRFGKVDEDLGRAFEKLTSETRKQADLLATQTTKVDTGLASALDRLQPFVKELGDGASDLAEAVEDLAKTLSNFNRESIRGGAR